LISQKNYNSRPRKNEDEGGVQVAAIDKLIQEYVPWYIASISKGASDLF